MNLKVVIVHLEAKWEAQNEAQQQILLELTSALRKKLASDQKIIVNPNFIPPKLPFKAKEDVDSFETNLKNESFFEQMVSVKRRYFKNIC